MKQTKAALTMLLKHYKAIYMHALLIALGTSSFIGGIANATDYTSAADGSLKAADGSAFNGFFKDGDKLIQGDAAVIDGTKFKDFINVNQGTAIIETNAHDFKIKNKGINIDTGATLKFAPKANAKNIEFDLIHENTKPEDHGSYSFNILGTLDLGDSGRLVIKNGELQLKGKIQGKNNYGVTLDSYAKTQLSIDGLKEFLKGGNLTLNANASDTHETYLIVSGLSDTKALNLNEVIGNGANKITLTKGEIRADYTKITDPLTNANNSYLQTKFLELNKDDNTAFSGSIGLKEIVFQATNGNDNLKLSLNKNKATTLNNSKITFNGSRNGSNIIEGKQLILDDGAILNIRYGELELNSDLKIAHNNAKILLSHSALKSSKQLEIDADNVIFDTEDNDLEFATLLINKDKKLTITSKDRDNVSTLIINGTKDGKNDLDLKGTLVLDGGDTDIGLDVLDELFDKNGNIVAGGSEKLKNINLKKAGLLLFDVDNSYTLSNDAKNKIIEALSGDNKKVDGFVIFGKNGSNNGGGNKPDVNPIPPKPNTDADPIAGQGFTWDSIKDTGYNQTVSQSVIQVSSENAQQGVYGSLGAVFINDKNSKLKITDTTRLNTASSNSHNGKNYFVSNYDAATKTITAGSINHEAKGQTLRLDGNGEVKDISLVAGKDTENTTNVLFSNGNVTVNDIKALGSNGSIAENTLAEFDAASVNAHEIIVSEVKTSHHAKVVADILKTNKISSSHNNFEVKDAILDIKGTDEEHLSNIDGSKVQIKNFTIKNAQNLDDGLAHISVRNGGLLSVDNINASNNTIINIGESSNARSLDKSNSNGSLFINDVSSYNGVINLRANNNASSKVVIAKGSLNNTNTVHNNSALVYGFKSDKDYVSYMQQNHLMQANEKLNAKVASSLVVNDKMNLGAKGKISLSANTLATDGNIVLGSQSAVVITKNAVNFNNKADAIVKVNKGNNVNVENAANIVLAGGFSIEEANGIRVFGDTNNANVLQGNVQNLTVTNSNLVLRGTVDTSTGLVKDVAINKYQLSKAYAKATAPVQDYLASFFFDKNRNKNVDKDILELTKTIVDLDGQDLEKTSRFAIYGGSFNALKSASDMSINALDSYMMKDSTLAIANGDKASVFVQPAYKKSESHDLFVNDKSYGTDVKLTGVVLGLDYKLQDNFSIGTLFNLGNGDAKGKDLGSNIDNDITYFGVGVFTNYIVNNLKLTADLNFTKVKSDLESNASTTYKDFTKYTASSNASALSLGLTSSYKFDLDSGFVEPFAAIRFTQFKLDDFTVNINNKAFIDNTYDNVQVLASSFGVKLSNSYLIDDVTLTPSFKAGVTFNLGDKEINHSAKGRAFNNTLTNLNSEVLDSVVFNVKGGLNASFNKVNLSLDLGYERGSSQEDLSVQALFKYAF